MSEQEISLSYEYIKDDNLHPEAINIQAKGVFNRTKNIVISAKDKFQRISFYENGIIISEEIYNGKHVFRFNVPFNELEPGKILLEN
ncbi:MAG: hypothetical protein SOI41_07365 [Heyndrickxia coagulans]|uniref:hypothetical protein n=1 Tax=Heyndrickxia coagulans TaxID=1398 RepID=UPI0018A71D02|nr:hypothetical protein [Heyndrickxia coagulans]MBF8418940.1 hypothetical protein [Heyndrickxia coagulans]